MSSLQGCQEDKITVRDCLDFNMHEDKKAREEDKECV